MARSRPATRTRPLRRHNQTLLQAGAPLSRKGAPGTATADLPGLHLAPEVQVLDSLTEDARYGVRARTADGDGSAIHGRRSSDWLPRCTRCGRWIAPPGGEGFGGGEIWCGPCVLRHIQQVASQEGR